ncbi:hypothetical protein [Streptomyces sp. RM72]|uniref:hypothetical protein n=1 Tax=Streptomyces sp. RM72 TaxID=1115510 RepID=UPI0027E3B270|nr:hypothetical protein [Streptomyces sp. RM72]
MNENRNDEPALPAPTTETPEPEAPESEAAGLELDVSAADDSVAPTGERPGRGRRIAVIGSALLLAAVTVAGAGYTVVTVKDADRDPGAPVWTLPRAAPEKKAEESAGAGGLARALVPYRIDGWSRGPDLGEFGSDATLSGAQATALRKESLIGLPRSERKELEREIDRRHITGMAMRNYASTGTLTADGMTGDSTVTIVLSRMENRSAVRDMATRQNEFFAALDVFREGPRIKGHKDARCFRLPGGSGDSGDSGGSDDLDLFGASDDPLDTLFCAASEGDVLVTVTADAMQPFDTEGVTALVTEQLDRIAEPGESV